MTQIRPVIIVLIEAHKSVLLFKIIACKFVHSDAITKSTPFFLVSGFVLVVSYVLFILASCSQHHTIHYFISGVLYIIAGKSNTFVSVQRTHFLSLSNHLLGQVF